MTSPNAHFEGLYAIVDVGAWAARGVDLGEGRALESIVEALVSTRPGALQLRAKDVPLSRTATMLRAMRPLTTRADVPLFANDRVDLALAAETDGVHLGQDDLPLADARRLAPHMMMGVSTHTRAQLAHALDARPDYVAFGPVFATKNKRNPDPVVGVEGAADAAKRAGDVATPLVAIGGIDASGATALARAGVHFGAAIGALVLVDARGRPDLASIEASARALRAAFLVAESAS